MNLEIPFTSYFLGYALTPNHEERPDIFQLSHLAFELAKKKCPVQNLHVSVLSLN